MLSMDDLKGVALFEDLTDAMVEKILAIGRIESLDERQIIYEEGAAADQFYSVRRGKVLLEAELAPGVIIALGAIKLGYSFGWSALFPDMTHRSYAVSAEPSDVIAMPGKDLVNILDSDHVMGFAVMQKSARILENRLDRRTQQFLKVITKHPEIGALLGM